ncbi:hypothetical protein [Cetobacterium somerae]|uniref:hypothetical protein n=1 Tax=Cetobacterium somerae TaxID=188913 RepID=UPI003891CC22
MINKFSGVSSSRFRVKDSEHLIAKIIRKKIEKKEIFFTLDNYEQEIQDLIGFRVIHIFKEEWNEIDQEIRRRWNVEICEYNQRKGDNLLKNTGLDYAKMEIKEHKRGYRSIHYIIKTKEIKHRNKFIEIQVRTIFEEAWSEMDHKVIYPYYLNNKVLNNYSLILNRVAGMADEMGNFMKNEVVSLSKLDRLDDENKKLKEDNERLKAKIREYENSLIDESKNMKKMSKEREDSRRIYKPLSPWKKYEEEIKKIYEPSSPWKKYEEEIKKKYEPSSPWKKYEEEIKKKYEPSSPWKKYEEEIKKIYEPLSPWKKYEEEIKKIYEPSSPWKKYEEEIKKKYEPSSPWKKYEEEIKKIYEPLSPWKKYEEEIKKIYEPSNPWKKYEEEKKKTYDLLNKFKKK